VNGAAEERPALYRDPVWLQREYRGHRRPISDLAEACGVSYHTIRKWLTRYNLTDPRRGRFAEANVPWNKGQTYQLGPLEPPKAWIAANRRARSGSSSNFWRAGGTTERDSIGRWTTEVAAKVHATNEWTCQLCHERASELHCHHVVPVWADLGRARDIENLTTLCGDCHRQISGKELEFVELLGGGTVKSEWVPRERIAWNRLDRAKLVRVLHFEFVGEKETYDLEVEGPYHNFVANGIVTHNSVNEYSGRYSLMPLLYYMPEREQFALQSAQNQQGREGDASDAVYEEAIERWRRMRHEASDGYTWMVGEDVAREIARIDLPLSTYTQWYWKIDLHNLLHFLSLRADPHAQWEIRVFAEIIAGMVKRVAPLSYEAWVDYDLVGQSMSRAELTVLSQLLDSGEDGITARSGASCGPDELKVAGLSGREIRELVAKLQAPTQPDFELDLSKMKSAEEVAKKTSEAVPSGPE
jgi:thymidylate synthase (FAD)